MRGGLGLERVLAGLLFAFVLFLLAIERPVLQFPDDHALVLGQLYKRLTEPRPSRLELVRPEPKRTLAHLADLLDAMPLDQQGHLPHNGLLSDTGRRQSLDHQIHILGIHMLQFAVIFDSGQEVLVFAVFHCEQEVVGLEEIGVQAQARGAGVVGWQGLGESVLERRVGV